MEQVKYKKKKRERWKDRQGGRGTSESKKKGKAFAQGKKRWAEPAQAGGWWRLVGRWVTLEWVVAY